MLHLDFPMEELRSILSFTVFKIPSEPTEEYKKEDWKDTGPMPVRVDGGETW